jgi:tripartite ATP-independent transporter DctM subunit
MMLAEYIDILLVITVLIVILSGYHVAFALGGVAILFALLGIALDVFPAALLNAIPSRIFGIMTNQVLVAVPLFVFMGVMLERSRLAEELLETMGDALSHIRGGLAIAVIAVGALLAASTGIVGATVVTMGLLSLPTMLRRGYDPALASGTIAASGTLGQIIPPSIVLVLLGDVISNAYQRAQREMGVFSPEPVSVGDLFAGALIPGLLLVLAYMAYVLFVAWTRPHAVPALQGEDRPRVSWARLGHALAPPLILMLAVLGSILTGVATATEAAALGAAGALMLAALRRDGEGLAFARQTNWAVMVGLGSALLVFLLAGLTDVRTSDDAALRSFAALLTALAALGAVAAVYRLWKPGVMSSVARSTAEITAMVFMILIGATIFSLVFRGFGGDELIENALNGSASALASGTAGLFGLVGLDELAMNIAGSDGSLAFFGVIVVMAVMFILGFFLDFIEIIFVVVPLVAPPLLMLGVDPVWLGVMMAVNLQTSFLTPPFGFALFYLRGVAPKPVKTRAIYSGAIPFVLIQIAALIAIAIFPIIATGLPDLLLN